MWMMDVEELGGRDMNRQINPAIKPRSHASPVRPTIDVGLEAIRPMLQIPPDSF
jgi:hypothetical protein